MFVFDSFYFFSYYLFAYSNYNRLTDHHPHHQHHHHHRHYYYYFYYLFQLHFLHRIKYDLLLYLHHFHLLLSLHQSCNVSLSFSSFFSDLSGYFCFAIPMVL
ncbi:unnamed protein product [Brugia timori]|uniref:Secreted protein n=1 Tax=Brugia timori TaxID=42155 RepID=A0A0R3QYQ7_9BILA|nr:unnamed protein product [Brugia timori]